MAWKIKGWQEYEPPKQNDRDQSGALKYWKCPVSQNRRYKMLVMSGTRGWEVLGIWHAIVASWGRQKRGSRKDGVLRTAMAGDNPATLEELAIDTFVPRNKLRDAVAKFVSLGWLEDMLPEGNPDGIHADSETRLDKTKQDKTRLEYIAIPDCQKVQLTQEDYDWLKTKWGEAAVEAMILEAEDFAIREPKKSKGRNWKLTINNWLTREAKKQAMDKLGGHSGRKTADMPTANPGKYDGIAKRAVESA